MVSTPDLDALIISLDILPREVWSKEVVIHLKKLSRRSNREVELLKGIIKNQLSKIKELADETSEIKQDG